MERIEGYRTYLHNGLTALARAGESGNWFNGHIGAAYLKMVWLIIEFPQFADDQEVLKLLNRWELENSGYFTPYGDDFLTLKLSDLMTALDKNIENLTADGHGVIYGSLALKTIKVLNQELPERMINGISNLLLSALSDNPHRYFGVQDYKLFDVDLSPLESIDNLAKLTDYLMERNDSVFPDTVINGVKYYFSGNRLHEWTHLHALWELNGMGYTFDRGLEGLKRQIIFDKLIPQNLSGFKPVYTRIGLNDITKEAKKDFHHYKLLYAVYRIAQLHQISNLNLILCKVYPHFELMD